MISQRQFDRVTGYIKKGVEEGATALVGGPGAETGFDKGYFVRPTLFTDVDNKMTIAQEEIFGPVLSVIPFDDEEDAIRIANDSPYGLAGNVMSGSLEHSLAVARRIKAGFIGRQRRRTLRRRYAVRWIQGQRRRPPERCGRFRPVHRDQIRGIPRGLTHLRQFSLSAGYLCPVTDAGQAQRATGRKMAIRYAAGLACGHLIGTADAAAIVIPLHGQFAGDARAYFAPTSLITATVIVVLGTVAVAAGGIANLVPVLRWFVAQQQPNSEQRRSAMRLLARQSMILAVVWAVSGITYLRAES